MYYLIFTGRKNGSMHANFVCSITGNSGNAGKALLGIWFIHPGTTTVINVYRCSRDLHHRGSIEDPLCITALFCIEGFKGKFNWAPIMPWNASLSNSKCFFFQRVFLPGIFMEYIMEILAWRRSHIKSCAILPPSNFHHNHPHSHPLLPGKFPLENTSLKLRFLRKQIILFLLFTYF